mmetsp:Transcript_31467/g.54730  ORF Transcript_31467/g.54730 Transcript_31467/m.54730 type:complete len:121 (+) Transcript_31467:233-595(+)
MMDFFLFATVFTMVLALSKRLPCIRFRMVDDIMSSTEVRFLFFSSSCRSVKFFLTALHPTTLKTDMISDNLFLWSPTYLIHLAIQQGMYQLPRTLSFTKIAVKCVQCTISHNKLPPFRFP